MKFLKWLVLSTGVALAGLVTWLLLLPPELLRVGDGYAAKIVCSNVFVAGRDPGEVLEVDVQAPGHPLLKLVRVAVDREEQTVTAHMFGFAAPGYAIHRQGLGCASVPDGDFDRARKIALPEADIPTGELSGPWPEGDAVSGPIDPRVQALLEDPMLTGPGLRAAVVVKDGRIVGEAYGAGFSETVPLLGWSMTKTVNAALIGLRIAEGAMRLEDRALLSVWAQDARKEISLADLLAMQSGLAFNENYGTVADVTRMLYLESDMAAYAASLPAEAAPGKEFSYSSGTATLLSRLWMDGMPGEGEALAYPRKALFKPLGMRSAVMETDEAGTFVGSSYLYATARDWARFSLFLLQDGVWNGVRMLPETFTALMRTPTEASDGVYGGAQAWTQRPGGNGANAELGLPEDTFWMSGHDGQSAMLVPSMGLAVIRMGLTPSKFGYRPQVLGRAVAGLFR